MKETFAHTSGKVFTIKQSGPERSVFQYRSWKSLQKPMLTSLWNSKRKNLKYLKNYRGCQDVPLSEYRIIPMMLSHGIIQWRIYIVKFWTRAPPQGPNSFNFVQFLGKFGKIVCWHPLEGACPNFGELLDPPLI